MFERITHDPQILGGKPVITGTRISVELILELLGSGASREDILMKYPHLSACDIREATEYAAAALRNDVIVQTRVGA
ncbi:hypothetical protein Spb1_00860 [Planctopirus ephydatiae]|jgi:uncharacterized protein (DUF433 family)|uniref:Antitoxin n=1 Tax=Planctopirus ephydatiae TaxID=2528019 RepID=A0A518GI11_9PLAN|nr:DUF433 domain-containing protein [Planctopirus ephydatiae]QDV28223.1 hypothetical protein Spb1_00860 [Planctopirus ephydatiae]